MHVVDPRDVSRVQVAAVRHDVTARSQHVPRSPGCDAGQERLAESVKSEWPWNAVHMNTRPRCQFRSDTMSDQVHVSCIAAGEERRERMVRRVHATDRNEVAGRKQPRGHARIGWRAATNP